MDNPQGIRPYEKELILERMERGLIMMKVKREIASFPAFTIVVIGSLLLLLSGSAGAACTLVTPPAGCYFRDYPAYYPSPGVTQLWDETGWKAAEGYHIAGSNYTEFDCHVPYVCSGFTGWAVDSWPSAMSGYSDGCKNHSFTPIRWTQVCSQNGACYGIDAVDQIHCQWYNQLTNSEPPTPGTTVCQEGGTFVPVAGWVDVGFQNQGPDGKYNWGRFKSKYNMYMSETGDPAVCCSNTCTYPHAYQSGGCECVCPSPASDDQCSANGSYPQYYWDTTLCICNECPYGKQWSRTRKACISVTDACRGTVCGCGQHLVGVDTCTCTGTITQGCPSGYSNKPDNWCVCVRSEFKRVGFVEDKGTRTIRGGKRYGGRGIYEKRDN